MVTSQWHDAAEERPLNVLGISEEEERVYCCLLAHPGSITAEIAGALALPRGKVQRLLDAIEAKGLVTHTPEQPRCFIAASPDIALEALALKHQELLQHARATISELQKHANAEQPDSGERVVELITSREAERQIFNDLHRTAQDEIITLTRPPLRVTQLDAPGQEQNQLQRKAQTRGVRYRSIVDDEFLSLPGAVDKVRNEIRIGEEFRTFPSLPFKMVLSDRRIAIIPLNLQQLDSPSLLVRSSALLDALYALFEMLWEHSSPASFTISGALKADRVKLHLSAQSADILFLMAAGLNDKSIAHELEISSSTLNRRIAETMHTFNARTRFQLGWLARQPETPSDWASGARPAGLQYRSANPIDTKIS
ncbi:MAG: helix-turn-helix domain-containing protein [Gammaproteobacteria bacterium]